MGVRMERKNDERALPASWHGRLNCWRRRLKDAIFRNGRPPYTKMPILNRAAVPKYRYSPFCIDAINRYHGRPDIPIGTLSKPGFMDTDNDRDYHRYIAENYPHRFKDGRRVPDAVAGRFELDFGQAADAGLVFRTAFQSPFTIQAESYGSMSGINNGGTVIGSCDDGDWAPIRR